MINMPVVSVPDDQEERAGVRMEANIKMWVLMQGLDRKWV